MGGYFYTPGFCNIDESKLIMTFIFNCNTDKVLFEYRD